MAMIGATISHYKILEKLGEGGMGVVYKAEDTKLKRTVALKFLPPELTRDEEAKRRFIREAQAASALQHHNICTIHEIDETPEGQLFICMDCYEGQTLKEKISSGLLSLEEALDIAIQATGGIAKAHSAGMVHRDIKPANIMITGDGVVKILDFGLAKLAEKTSITKTGRTPGTPSYMSPEQARGETVDERSDIFSLGVVLYELLTGRQPFRGDYEAAVLYEVVHEHPEPITNHRSDVPEELEHVVNKALEKDPVKRYQHSDELMSDLKIVHKSVTKGTAIPASLLAKIPLTKRLKISMIMTAGMIAVAFIAAILILYPRPSVPFTERDWVLITDFINLTGDEIFDRSLNMALTVSIQQSRHVNIYPRSRIKETLKRMGKKQADTLDVRLGSEIAQREGIRALLVPTISSIEGVYLLSAQIVDPSTLVDLKTEMVQAAGKNEILNALGDLARKVRKNLGESLPSIARRNVPLPQATTHSLEALKKFSEGSWYWNNAKYEEAPVYWLEAVKLDSTFALAHTSLGTYYYWNERRPEGDEHFEAALRHIDKTTEREKLWILSSIKSWRGNNEEANKYMELLVDKYPDNRDAWYNLGVGYMREERHEDALEAYRKTLDLDPHMAKAYINIATCHNIMGKPEEAIPNYQKAFKEQPDWIIIRNLNHEYGYAYVKMGEFDKAREIFQKILTASGDRRAGGLRSLALLDMYLGRYSSAIEYLKEAITLAKIANYPVSEMRNRLFLAAACKRRQMMDDFNTEMNEFERIHENTYIPPLFILIAGKLYAREGMIEHAFKLLEDLSSGKEKNLKELRMATSGLEGEIELINGNISEAIGLLEISYQLRKDSLNQESLAYAYYKSGNLDQAIATYEELIESKLIGLEGQEYWLQAHIQLGKIYEEKGDTDSAVRTYEQLLSLWKGADEDLPVLLEVRERLSALK